MDIDKKLTEILTSTLVIENKKGIPFAIAKLREFIKQKQSNEEAVKDANVYECPYCSLIIEKRKDGTGEIFNAHPQ